MKASHKKLILIILYPILIAGMECDRSQDFSFRTVLAQRKQQMLEIMSRENVKLSPEQAIQLPHISLLAREHLLTNREVIIENSEILTIAERIFKTTDHQQAFREVLLQTPDTQDAYLSQESALNVVARWKKAGEHLNREWRRLEDLLILDSSKFKTTQAYCLLIYLHVACFLPLKGILGSEQALHDIYFGKSS